jgi:spore coat protein U-like protein
VKRIMLLLAAMLLASTGAQAACIASTVSTSGVAFGSFNPLAGQSANTTGTISVTCTGVALTTASYTITIASGHGSFLARKMVSGSNNLTYNLYRDSAFTQVWGDGSGSTFTVHDSVTIPITLSITTNYVAYSRIASGQNAAKAGTYADSLLVTVTY